MSRLFHKFALLPPALALVLASATFAADTPRASAPSKSAQEAPATGNASPDAASPKATVIKPKLEGARLDAYAASEKEKYFALSLVPQNLASARVPHDVIVLFDTSASQTGAYRDKGLQSLAAILAMLDPHDRVLLTAVDLHCVPMSEGFVETTGKGINAGLTKLMRRVPLATTDLGVVLEESMKKWDAKSTNARNMIYIGDGISNSNGNDVDLKSILVPLVDHHVSVSCLAIGPERDGGTLATIANRTGGMLVIDDAGLPYKTIGSFLALSADESVIWPSSVQWPKDLTVYPAIMPPLRMDRDSVVIGRGSIDRPLELKIAAELNGKPINLSWTIKPAVSDDSNAYLPELVNNAKADEGATLPTLGTEGLQELRRASVDRSKQFQELGRQAVKSGNLDQARKLLGESVRRDPTNTLARAMLDSLDKKPTSKAAKTAAAKTPSRKRVVAKAVYAPGDLIIKHAPAAEEVAPVEAPAETEAGLLQDEIQGRTLRRQVLNAEVVHELAIARDRLRTDPSGVINNMSSLLERVTTSADLLPDNRDSLGKQITTLVRVARVRQVEKEHDDAEIQGRLANAREQERLLSQLDRNQVRVKSLMDRFDSLMSEGRYVEAEDAANESRAIVPLDPTTTVAVLSARTTGYHMANLAVREATQKAFIDTLHLVDVSHIPFPDDPPIVYPDARVWTALTESRKKYSSVDLKKQGGAEERILKALDEPTNISFDNIPLNEAIDYLKQQHNIEIQLDSKALEAAGVGFDTPVSRNLKGVTLRSALRLMLKQLDLTYIIQNEVLLITTSEEANNKMVTKVYPVADLVLPIPSTGFIGGFGGLGGQANGNNGFGNGGQQQQSNFGGGGQGAFGGGGGQGGGGGFQSIADDLSVAPVAGGLQAYALPDELSVKPSSPAISVEAKTEGTTPSATVPAASSSAASAAPIKVAPRKVAAIQLPTKPGEDLEQSWDNYFANWVKLEGTEAEKNLAIAERGAAVRETVRKLVSERKYESCIGLIDAALRNGYPQPWMYEALGLALQATDRSPEEIERALMSAADFSSTPNDLMMIAMYMTRVQGADGKPLDARALKLCRQVARLNPSLPEPYLQGIEIASRLKDIAGIKWACVGVLSQAWPAEQDHIQKKAQYLAEATIKDLERSNPKDAAEFKAAIAQALLRDVVVQISYNGDAGVELVVEEPQGTVCSSRNPRTTSGGVLRVDSAARSGKVTSDGYTEQYIAPQAFGGQYHVLVRRVYGKVTAGKVTVDVYTHVGSKGSEVKHIRQQVPVNDKNAMVVFDLTDGRRQDALPQDQAAVAAAGQVAMNRAILAQQLDSLNNPAAIRDLVLARNGGRMPNGNGVLGRGAVGFQPVITTLPEGTNFAATAVISADRRYVRITSVPLFSNIGDVQTFNFSTGQSVSTPPTNSGGGGTGAGGGAGGGGGFR